VNNDFMVRGISRTISKVKTEGSSDSSEGCVGNLFAAFEGTAK
jgi:hypothetical protein